MSKQTTGIHHITAIVGHPQENVDFYAGILGLRLVKKTVNFDDPGTYHLYFGNEGAEPGTIITFFPWIGAYQGEIGGGQVGITTYAIPEGTMPFWKERFEKFNISVNELSRFNEDFLQFEDPHGLKLELVERSGGKLNHRTFGDITPEVAIKGFGGAVLYSTNSEKTLNTLKETMGLNQINENDESIRFQSSGDIGNIIDVKKTNVPRGRMGVGTVHHIAWRANDKEDLLAWQNYVADKGEFVTEVKDRNYFNAIYFREAGEILYEIATDPPGFAHDESYETMGEALKLPPQYESHREKLTRTLVPIEVRELD